MRNKVFIATSFDGYIADKNGGIEWLTNIPNPSNSDGGFSKFVESIDAILMGRNTFEKVLSFGIEWPYTKKVFVWSSKLEQIPISLKEKVELVQGDVKAILKKIYQNGFESLYIDGGKTIQSLLLEGLIHEITVTIVPVILGEGIPLLGNIPRSDLKLVSSLILDNDMVQIHYKVICSDPTKNLS